MPCSVCGGDHPTHPVAQLIEDTASDYFGCNEVREYLTALLGVETSKEYAAKMLALHPATGKPAEDWLARNMNQCIADLKKDLS